MKSPRTVLLISAVDPTGGAGMNADIRTCTLMHVYPASCVTALTVQNHHGVSDVMPAEPAFLLEQLEAVYECMEPDAVKIGLLPNPELVRCVASVMQGHAQKNVVLDPVLGATAGGRLMPDPAATGMAMIHDLIPLCSIVTPNIPEYHALSGRAGVALENICRIMLLKGGHAVGDCCEDVMYDSGSVCRRFSEPKVKTPNLHGTGCVLSAGIAASLARGLDMADAVAESKSFLFNALRHGQAADAVKDYGPALSIF